MALSPACPSVLGFAVAPGSPPPPLPCAMCSLSPADAWGSQHLHWALSLALGDSCSHLHPALASLSPRGAPPTASPDTEVSLGQGPVWLEQSTRRIQSPGSEAFSPT